METATLQHAENLQTLSELSRRDKKPILLMFSQEDCPFCHTLKEEILDPMQLGSYYRDRLIMRELLIDAGETVMDFNGVRVEAMDIFDRYGMVVTPTILIIDSSGKEIAERQVGVNTVEMYAWYLDNAIDDAITQVRGKN